MDERDDTAPDAAELERLAIEALGALPEAFRAHARDVVIRVEEFASDAMLDDLGIESAFELTGLYDGVPLTQKSVADQPEGPDMI